MKKKKIVLFVFLLIGVLSLILMYKLKQNNLSKNKPIKEEKLSIMIKESGATDYTKSSSKDIPKGNYTLNTEKSYCKNNGKIEGYDSTTGTVSFAFIGTDRCFLYFDYIMPKLYDIIAERYNNGDTYVKLYNGSDYGDTTTYANNIYYFNGAVENNNVLFANYCWKIVRTTDTGGVKIVYNGTLKDGSCNNTGIDSQIGTSAFNSSSNSPAYVGYMYNENKVYTYSSKSMSSQSNIVFGNSFDYNGTYTLKDTMTVEKWSSGYNTINNNHYTCMTTGTSCTNLFYVYYTDSAYAYYITLANGKSVNDALNEMLYVDDVNTKDSTIKAYIDSWYETNLKDKYDDKLEDTVFCNDRSISSLGGWNPNGGSTTKFLTFKNIDENYSLACENKNDRFTASDSNGNGALPYPVGLLTSPEGWLACKGADYDTYYLNTGNGYWLVSPSLFFDYTSYNFTVNANGFIDYSNGIVGTFIGVRPSISLKPNTIPTSGDGSYTNPFVIN